ncbi:MAG: BrnA antitoxin family protein, partial [Candidatus Saccharimonadales bacterium]
CYLSLRENCFHLGLVHPGEHEVLRKSSKPVELVYRTEKERIIIAIDKHSLDLFKLYAKNHDAKYQSMINEILRSYADKFLSR